MIRKKICERCKSTFTQIADEMTCPSCDANHISIELGAVDLSKSKTPDIVAVVNSAKNHCKKCGNFFERTNNRQIYCPLCSPKLLAKAGLGVPDKTKSVPVSIPPQPPAADIVNDLRRLTTIIDWLGQHNILSIDVEDIVKLTKKMR